MKGLTKKQGEILEYIKREVRLKGYPPSVREICYAVQLSSTSSVHAHLNSLERLGYIRRDPSKPRAIEILPTELDKQNKELADVPIVGRVTAGAPVLAIENIEDTFPVPVEYIGNKDVFMLRVSGESMINVGIYDRDLILVQKQSSAKNGDIVVALIEDSATVKTFYKDHGRIRLQPENDAMLPIYVEEVMILGVVIGLFRMF